MNLSSPRRLASSLLKLVLIIAGIYGVLYLLFDVGPGRLYELVPERLRAAPAMDRSLAPGPRIIFRLDDVEQGVREAQTFAILSVFREHGVPVELGIIPYAGGRDSYALPRLRTFVDEGVAQIGVHGITHEPYEFDTGRSGNSREALRDGLRKANDTLEAYYGTRPMAFLVPYDFFDETGYNAANDAGFRIFSSQWQTDRHRGTQAVDFDGQADASGMHRIPSVDDAVAWNGAQQTWGDFQPLSNLLYSVRASLDEIGVAVVSLHPTAFEDEDGGVDDTKLAKLTQLIEELRQLGMITTFTNWYCFKADAANTPDVQDFCSVYVDSN